MAEITKWVKKIWKNRTTEFPTRRTLMKEDGSSEIVTVTRNEGTVSEEGDAFDADTMNNLEERIDAGFAELNGKLGNLLTTTITSGDTSATITDSKIKSTSIIDIYFENKVLAPENVTVSDGSIIVEISAQDTDTVVGVRVI